ncbi:MAG: N-acetyl-gamma-glutamyl-phosphate reductase [Clostridiales bacterium]|nr:N-acetyl-gamma-glutamyl-phosphate reductase [Clostridiales bacterium]
MNKLKVFIDGREGTTGLRIHERLGGRDEIELLLIEEEKRKDLSERLRLLDAADAAFLCLPDAASREICEAAEQEGITTRILDTSTAHRTAEGWTYGFPELHSGAQRELIRKAQKIAVPGCHATGFVSLAAPLVELGIAAPDYPFTVHSLTGYSGGGKKMIAAYEDAERPRGYSSPRQYALGQTHKHLPEMTAVCGLSQAPVFNPIVADYYCGMEVTVPLHGRLLAKKVTPKEVAEALAQYYKGSALIKVHAYGVAPEDGTLPANKMAGSDALEIFVLGREEQMILVSRFDNLGKGASGAAVQCMNLALGLPETTGLATDL